MSDLSNLRRNTRSNSFSRRHKTLRIIVISIIAITVLGVFVSKTAILPTFFTVTAVENCTVNGKDRMSSQEGGTITRVYTEQCGVFTADDSILDFKFNSSDLYGSIKEGQTYDFQTRGARIPIFSAFPNIIEAKLS